MSDVNPERDPLELLAAEYMEQLRQGRNPSVEEYAARYPELAEEIRELFPTIAVTERLKAKQERTAGGRASLGAAQPKRLGDFRLIREIGRGGMGVVFEAEQESLGRRVAVKVLPKQVLLDEKHLKRFEREARIAANLHHTNIVEVFGVGEQDGFHYYVMQCIRGVGLDRIVPRLTEALRASNAKQAPPAPQVEDSPANGAISDAILLRLLGNRTPGSSMGSHYWQSVSRIALQAAEALEYAHSQGVLHRDVKPANLLLDPQATVWLTDFGLAKAAQSGEVSLSRDVVGTLRYMAPEQFRGNSDQRSDIYSLGLTLYELLALQPAFGDTDQSRLIHRITQGPAPAPPSSCGLGVPRDLETILLKAISPDPAQRYSSARAMAEDLRCFLEDRPIHARRVGPAERLARWCRRNKGIASLAGTTLFLLAMVAAVASIGYVRTRKALAGEAAERARAEATVSLAIEALDQMFERFSPTRMRVAPQPTTAGDRAEITGVANSPILSKEAVALLEEMLPFYDRLAQQTGNNDKLRLETAKANQRVGAIRQRLGQFNEGIQAYSRGIALYDQLRASPVASPALDLEMARINNELGRIYTSSRQFSEAREAHQAALAILDKTSPGFSSPEWLFELARTCYFLGTQERPLPATGPRKRGGSSQQAGEEREFLARSIGLLGTLSWKNPEARHLLALCCLEGAPAETGPGPAGRTGAERAIEILEKLVQEFPDNPDYAYDLSEAYSRLHIPTTPISPEDREAIEARLGEAVALLEKLVSRHPEVPDFPAAEARARHKLGSFYRQMGDWGKAENNFRRAIDLQAPLVKQFPEAPYHGLWMATFRIALADALLHRDDPEDARTTLEEAIATLTSELEKRPELSRPHDLLSLGYSKLEAAFRQLGYRDKAEEAARKAEEERSATRSSP